MKLAHVEDSKNFPGGKNYQTTINNEMKQIFSYIPREMRKYQEIVQKQLILPTHFDKGSSMTPLIKKIG